jgi:ceramide glucosyltransferase
MMLLGLTIAIVGVTAGAHFAGILLLLARPRSVRRPALERPPVTILRPFRGIENNVEETLSSTFVLEYPDYEILFCVAEHADPVVPLILRLIAEHPHVRARLLVGEDRISINPKLNNLVKGWNAAAHDWIVMTDSNVLMPPDYLDQVLERWRPGTGLVSSPPIGIRPQGIGAELECAILNTYQARWQLIADMLGIAFAQGKTILWRREHLVSAGGITALTVDPAEDAAFTKVIRASGYKVRLVTDPFPQPLGVRPLSNVWSRQVRWARLRRSSFPLVYLSEVISGGLLPLTASGVLVAMGILPGVWFSGLLLAWYGAEVALARRYGWPVSPRITLLMVVRDLLLWPIWLLGWTGTRFIWRGSAMDIKAADAAPHRRLARWRTSRTMRSALMLATRRRSVAKVEQGDGSAGAVDGVDGG